MSYILASIVTLLLYLLIFGIGKGFIFAGLFVITLLFWSTLIAMIDVWKKKERKKDHDHDFKI